MVLFFNYAISICFNILLYRLAIYLCGWQTHTFLYYLYVAVAIDAVCRLIRYFTGRLINQYTKIYKSNKNDTII